MRKTLRTMLAGVVALCCLWGTAIADELHDQWNATVAGKWIAYIPVSNSQGLPHIWGEVMKRESEALGIKFTIHDPDFDAQRELQILNSLIGQKPDVLVVHPPNVSVLNKALAKAEKAGIYVIQVNMASRYRSDAYVGIHPPQVGRMMAEEAVKVCSAADAPSRKIALMNGEVTSAYSIGIQEGLESVLKEHKDIQVVSDQAANWDSKTAYDKASTVLQAHPDLCAYIGRWTGQDIGIAQAVKQADLVGKVKVISTGGGERPACEYLEKDLFHVDINYQVEAQGHEMMAIAKFLLQTNQPPGTFRTTIYTPVVAVTKENLSPSSCSSIY